MQPFLVVQESSLVLAVIYYNEGEYTSEGKQIRDTCPEPHVIFILGGVER